MNGLVLVPTPMELEVIRPMLGEHLEKGDWKIANCGFGPVVAASCATALIGRHLPSRVLLLGIAGAFDDDSRVGSALAFDAVHSWGVGVGSQTHLTPKELRWVQCVGDRVIPERIELSNPAVNQPENVLLTVCAASADAKEADEKHKAIPDATAEDMEGYGVAVSCQMASIPLTILRGISNRVGDRKHEHWEIDKALRSVSQLAIDLILEPQ